MDPGSTGGGAFHIERQRTREEERQHRRQVLQQNRDKGVKQVLQLQLASDRERAVESDRQLDGNAAAYISKNSAEVESQIEREIANTRIFDMYEGGQLDK